jgi:hypothetical protein
MNTNRKTARIVGALFIAATVATILREGVFLGPILDAPDYLINVSANENQVIIGEFFMLIDAVAVASIAIAVYPVLKKHNESIALGYVGARIIEGVLFIVVVISTLTLLSLSQEFVKAGAPDASYFQTGGALLLAASDWAFMLGLTVFCLGALIFYYLLYQSKLIPRWLSVWGLIGATMTLAAGLLPIFGQSSLSALSTFLNLPIFVQEMVLAVWLIVKGFNPSAIASESA